MRSIGLCILAAMLVAACEDAVGTGYAPGEPGPAMEPAGLTPAERAARLGLSQEIAYTCEDGGQTAHVTLYGQEEMAALSVPGILEAPAWLECSPTRAGPECVNDTVRALLNTVNRSAELSDSATGFSASCTEMKPD